MNISDREHASLNCDEDAGWRATTKYKNITKQHSSSVANLRQNIYCFIYKRFTVTKKI